MRSIAVIGLVLTTALAGCVGGPASEQLTISITDVGKRPYVIGVPLLLSDAGPNASAWMQNAAIHSGQVTQFHLHETDQGTALWIAGNGTVTVGFSDVRSDAGAHFTRADWTLGVGPDGVRPLLVVQQGDVDVNWFYEGVSEHCFLTGSFGWQANGTGTYQAVLGGRLTPSPDCPI